MKKRFKFLDKEERQKRCNIAADLVISHYKHFGVNTFHSRLFDTIFFNEMITIGEDITEGIKYRNEHIVPSRQIVELSLRKVQDGESHSDVSDFIFRNFFIIRIDENKQKKLDATNESKISMGINWKDGDSPLDRIRNVYNDDFDEKIKIYETYGGILD